MKEEMDRLNGNCKPVKEWEAFKEGKARGEKNKGGRMEG